MIRRLRIALWVWTLGTAIVVATTYSYYRVDRVPAPSAAVERWAIDTLTTPGLSAPVEARRFRAAAPIIVVGYRRGHPRWRYIGTRDLVSTIEGASAEIAENPRRASLEFAITVPLGAAPLPVEIAQLAGLSIMPLRDGIIARHGNRVAAITPDELIVSREYERGMPLIVPEFRFGVDSAGVTHHLARALEAPPGELSFERIEVVTWTRAAYPGDDDLRPAALRDAVVDGVRFLIRHQSADGMYTYRYDGNTGESRPSHYNLARHSGTAFFLARSGRLLDLPEARESAIAALQYLEQHHVSECGSADRLCISEWDRGQLGYTALTMLAATEILREEDVPWIRTMLDGFSAFMRAQQREDGELMHEYSLARNRPIDVQHVYYSGEGALALLLAHRVDGDERNLEAARRLLAYLTASSWNFVGGRYFYGSEHWTCMAIAEGWDRIPNPTGLDFCLRWGKWSSQLLIGPDETPWRAEGGFGVGAFSLPITTMSGSTIEAMVPIYEVANGEGHDVEWLRTMIEEAIRFNLRHRWAPGPVHLLADPDAAHGAVPGSPASLEARNDFTQHAANAFLSWLEVSE